MKIRRLLAPIMFFGLSAFAAGQNPSTVSFSSYAAENFKILAKRKKPATQVAFQDKSMFRLPASETPTAPPTQTDSPKSNGTSNLVSPSDNSHSNGDSGDKGEESKNQ